MNYDKKSLLILSVFNLILFTGRISRIIRDTVIKEVNTSTLVGVRPLLLFLMSLLLILVAYRLVNRQYAAIAAYAILAVYLWLAFEGGTVDYDTILNISMMLLVYSTIEIYRCAREDRQHRQVISRRPISLDLRISEPSHLFHPLVIGPNLEISPEITGVVDYYLSSSKELAPLELNIYSRVSISEQIQDTAIEAYQKHYQYEMRRRISILESRARRSNLLFFISMGIVFLSIYFEDIVGNSAVWLVLSSMSGFFLWEIGNTHFRHMDDYNELERVLVSGEADITFL